LNRNEIKALTEIAEDLVSYGKKAGADEIEVTISGGNEFNLDVRLEKIENLTEAGSRYLSAKIIKDHRTAYTRSFSRNIAPAYKKCRCQSRTGQPG